MRHQQKAAAQAKHAVTTTPIAPTILMQPEVYSLPTTTQQTKTNSKLPHSLSITPAKPAMPARSTALAKPSKPANYHTGDA